MITKLAKTLCAYAIAAKCLYRPFGDFEDLNLSF